MPDRQASRSAVQQGAPRWRNQHHGRGATMSKETKPDAWMPLYIGDYKKDTGRLTTELHGAYLLLIMEYWSTGPLADDDDELAAITVSSPKEWKRMRPKIARFFIVG